MILPRRYPVEILVDRAVVVVLLLALAWLLGACSEPLPLFVHDARVVKTRDDLPPVVIEACDLLQIECVAVDEHRGAIRVDLVQLDPAARVRGRAGGSVCMPVVWADAEDAATIAHEIGHVLGLEHVNHERNLMFPHARPDAWELSTAQMDDLRRGGWRLLAC